MPNLRDFSESFARGTTRRGFLGRGADLLFGALAGAAAGATIRSHGAVAGGGGLTACAFPGPACRCENCQENGVCAKPCFILTTYYASGCWVASQNGATCCDCDCSDAGHQVCGCGTDYHNNPSLCP